LTEIERLDLEKLDNLTFKCSLLVACCLCLSVYVCLSVCVLAVWCHAVAEVTVHCTIKGA